MRLHFAPLLLIAAAFAPSLASAQAPPAQPERERPLQPDANPAAPGRGRGRAQVSTAPTPRTPDGKPDLSGNWQPNAIGQNVDLVRSGVEVPMQPWAAAVYKERKDALSKDDPEARCLPPGVPRMSTTPYPWTMVQTPKLLVIVYEGGAHIWRKIFLDGR